MVGGGQRKKHRHSVTSKRPLQNLSKTLFMLPPFSMEMTRYFPARSPCSPARASTTTRSTSLRSARVQAGGRLRPRMLRPVRTLDDRTYRGSKLPEWI
ncbi:hypothetical protein EYF80_009951 [Liparis tanakae]|uniref:Uncharacterized protein n=1 Tax=Liparis tanakae TaxID=230148 RepID=A0A4Z2IQV5_9TELE|nr:hypothetical protein EYF80_009951 [Liparis tanakae]